MGVPVLAFVEIQHEDMDITAAYLFFQNVVKWLALRNFVS